LACNVKVESNAFIGKELRRKKKKSEEEIILSTILKKDKAHSQKRAIQ